VSVPGPSTVACLVLARGRLSHLRRTLEGLAAQTHPPDEVVLVAMDDPEVARIGESSSIVTRIDTCPLGPTGSLPLAAARNLAARGTSSDLLVFLDVDCIPAPDLVTDYLRQQRPGLLMGSVGYLPPGVDPGSPPALEVLHASAAPHPSRPAPRRRARRADRYELFWSLNFAVERATWRRLGGFDESYEGYGAEDTDLAFTARRMGVPAWFVVGAEAFHQHHPVGRPPVEHVESIVHNARRFHQKWGTWPMEGWLREFAALGLVEWEPSSPRPSLRCTG
jgi:N-acetylglucosaminyl-diphospho-decaprenol L-rhamnosyltransferase